MKYLGNWSQIVICCAILMAFTASGYVFAACLHTFLPVEWAYKGKHSGSYEFLKMGQATAKMVSVMWSRKEATTGRSIGFTKNSLSAHRLPNIPSGYGWHSHGKWPIEIDGLPINSMVIFHGKLLNNQRICRLLLAACWQPRCQGATGDLWCTQHVDLDGKISLVSVDETVTTPSTQTGACGFRHCVGLRLLVMITINLTEDMLQIATGWLLNYTPLTMAQSWYGMYFMYLYIYILEPHEIEITCVYSMHPQHLVFSCFLHPKWGIPPISSPIAGAACLHVLDLCLRDPSPRRIFP